MKILFRSLTSLLVLLSLNSVAQKNKSYELKSPDGNIVVKIDAGEQLQWSVMEGSSVIIAPSALSMQLQSGEVLGKDVKVSSAKNEKVNTTIKAIHYIKDVIPDVYNQLTLNCKNDYGVIFRVYNDGAAYRFFTKKKGELVITNEGAAFNFDKDYNCFVPFVRDFRGKEQYVQSFEALYTEKKISGFNKDTLGFFACINRHGRPESAFVGSRS